MCVYFTVHICITKNCSCEICHSYCILQGSNIIKYAIYFQLDLICSICKVTLSSHRGHLLASGNQR